MNIRWNEFVFDDPKLRDTEGCHNCGCLVSDYGRFFYSIYFPRDVSAEFADKIAALLRRSAIYESMRRGRRWSACTGQRYR